MDKNTIKEFSPQKMKEDRADDVKQYPRKYTKFETVCFKPEVKKLVGN